MVKITVDCSRMNGGVQNGDTASRRLGSGGEKGQGQVASDVQGFAFE
jgi:hypothetical protein